MIFCWPLKFCNGSYGVLGYGSFYSSGKDIFNVLVMCSSDWGPKIDVVGFCFLDLASNYVPPDSLVKWLEGGGEPIYIGFGSLVSFFLRFFLLLVIGACFTTIGVRHRGGI